MGSEYLVNISVPWIEIAKESPRTGTRFLDGPGPVFFWKPYVYVNVYIFIYIQLLYMLYLHIYRLHGITVNMYIQ